MRFLFCLPKQASFCEKPDIFIAKLSQKKLDGTDDLC